MEHDTSSANAAHADVARVASMRWRVAIALTVAMVVIYFGFVALVAYGKELLAHLIVPGLSVGIVLGALTIVGAIALTGVYVAWANKKYDAALHAARTGGRPGARDDARDGAR